MALMVAVTVYNKPSWSFSTLDAKKSCADCVYPYPRVKTTKPSHHCFVRGKEEKSQTAEDRTPNSPIPSSHGVEPEPIISKPRIDNTGLALAATKSAFPADSFTRISKNLLRVGRRSV